jgi:arginase
MDWQLTGIPYTSMRQAGGIAEAIGVLRDRALASRLGALGIEDAGDLPLRPPSGERGDSGILNEAALVDLVATTRRRVSECHRRGRIPLLVGGDCPVLLGPLAALGEGGHRPGLVMADGHEDAWPPGRSPTGEASDSEVAIALGRVGGLPGPLAELVPLLDPSGLVYLGPRDSAELAAERIDSLREEAAFFAADAEMGWGDEAARVMEAALAAIDADRFWLHVDLDVLSTESFPAVDYPQPGGLQWEQLDALTAAAVADSRFAGASVVIYNPDLDPGREAADRLVDFVARLVEAS